MALGTPLTLKTLKAEFPDLRLSLRGGIDGESLDMLANGELDLVIGPETGPVPRGIEIEVLAEARLVLLAPESAGAGTAATFLKRNAGRLPLIALSPKERVCRLFMGELARLGIDWQPALELGGLDLIQRYVEEGFGVGLSVEGTASEIAEGFRALTLDRFPKLKIAAFHAKTVNEITARLLHLIRSEVKRFRANKADNTESIANFCKNQGFGSGNGG
jgi:DNA-binding transcriptional LysR family regulator